MGIESSVTGWWSRLRAMALLSIALALASVVGGCAGQRGAGGEALDAEYVFVYLKSGPKSGSGTPEERKERFAGHMANISRLADAGIVIAAGPFAKPADKSWRGVLVMDVASEQKAVEEAGTDPAVIAGEFVAEPHAMRGPSSLRGLMALERAMQEEIKGVKAEPGQLPPGLRRYVMVTAEDFGRACAAVRGSAWRDGVVWSGRFAGTPRGLIVIDAQEAAAVRAGLEGAGACAVDGWIATEAMVRMRGR